MTTWASLDQFIARRGNHYDHNILVFLILCLKVKTSWSLRYLDDQISANESSIKQVKIPSTFLSSDNNTIISYRFKDQTISSFFLYYYLWSVFHFNHTIWSHPFTCSLSFFLSSLRQLQLRTPRLTLRTSKSEMVAEMVEAVVETNARSGEAIHTTSTLAIRAPRSPFPKSVLLSHPPAGTSEFYQISSRWKRPDELYIGTVIPVFGTKPPEAGSKTRISLEDAVCDPSLFIFLAERVMLNHILGASNNRCG